VPSIVVNGEDRTTAPGTTVSALLHALGLADSQVAVERNRDIVPRAQWEQTTLGEGDRIEVVTFVGGG
jgi:thiamine biosynthesis protein ThiS